MNRILTGDCRTILPQLVEQGVRVQTCITSPPYYGLRDYGLPGQIGIEDSLQAYIDELAGVFRMVRKLLSKDGTLWLNLGDCYSHSGKGRNGDGSPFAGHEKSYQKAASPSGKVPVKRDLPVKNLMGIPWRVALALQDDGWYLRQDIIWHKTNPMPQSVTDRCVSAHEYLFLFSKRPSYFFNHEAIQEESLTYGQAHADSKADLSRETAKCGAVVPGQMAQHRKHRMPVSARPLHNRRSVWSLPTKPSKHAHLAAFPPDLVEPCVLAGSRPGDCVLDPFGGSGTVAEVANRLGREWISIELDPQFAPLHAERTIQASLPV